MPHMRRIALISILLFFLISLWSITSFAKDQTPPVGIAGNPSCQSYFGVRQFVSAQGNSRLLGLYMTPEEKKWWSKHGAKQFSGLCYLQFTPEEIKSRHLNCPGCSDNWAQTFRWIVLTDTYSFKKSTQGASEVEQSEQVVLSGAMHKMERSCTGPSCDSVALQAEGAGTTGGVGQTPRRSVAVYTADAKTQLYSKEKQGDGTRDPYARKPDAYSAFQDGLQFIAQEQNKK